LRQLRKSWPPLGQFVHSAYILAGNRSLTRTDPRQITDGEAANSYQLSHPKNWCGASAGEFKKRAFERKMSIWRRKARNPHAFGMQS